MFTTRPAKIICTTPVRNEAWILERFLRAAEMWADHIIVADQGSTDESVAIARRFSKVRVVENKSAYDEASRQRLLLAEAREIEGPKFVVALDADEFLTPTWRDAPEWEAALLAPAGTVFSFDWVNVLPGGSSAHVPSEKVPFAFVDDGSDHRGGRIHSRRIPMREASVVQPMNDVKVLHLQFTAWQRMKSKQRWYQCWERLHSQRKRPIQIYRQYHQMDAFPPGEVYRIDPDWLARYAEWGIRFDVPPNATAFWWDEEVLNWLVEYGTHRFRRLNIWDVPWPDLARQLGIAVDPETLSDPRDRMERAVHRWLARTQGRAGRTHIRQVQRLLVLLGW